MSQLVDGATKSSFKTNELNHSVFDRSVLSPPVSSISKERNVHLKAF